MSTDSSDENVPRKRKKQTCRSELRRRRRIIDDSSSSSDHDEDVTPEQKLALVHAKLPDVEIRLITVACQHKKCFL